MDNNININGINNLNTNYMDDGIGVNNNNNADYLFGKYEILDGVEIKIPNLPVTSLKYNVYSGKDFVFASPAYTTCELARDIMEFLDINNEKTKDFVAKLPKRLKYFYESEDFISDMKEIFIDELGYGGDLTKMLCSIFDNQSKFGTEQAYSLVRLTFIGQGDNDIVNCGLDTHPQNFIYLCYKLAGRIVPECFMDKIYNATTSDQEKYAHRDQNGIYYNLFSLIKRKYKNKVKENIIKIFANANKTAIKFTVEDFDFDKLDLHEFDFIIKELNGHKYLNLVSDGKEKSKSKAAEKICSEVIKILDKLARTKNEQKKLCYGVDKIYIEDIISDFDLEYCKKYNSFGYDNSDQLEKLIKEDLLFNLKIHFAGKLNEVNNAQTENQDIKFDIDPKVIDRCEDNAAIYFFLSVCYSVLFPVYESGSKESMDKLLKNLEQICVDFSLKNLDSNYLNLDSNENSYYIAFIKKIIGRNIDEKELARIKETQEKMACVLFGTDTVSEIAMIKIKKETDLAKNKIPIVRVFNDQLLVSDLFFMFGAWREYLYSIFNEIQEKYNYKYKFCDTKNELYRTRIENLISELLCSNLKFFNYLEPEMKLFAIYKLLDSSDLKNIVGYNTYKYHLYANFFEALKNIADNQIRENICLKLIRWYRNIDSYENFGATYFMLNNIISSKGFEELFKTVSEIEPTSNDLTDKPGLSVYWVHSLYAFKANLPLRLQIDNYNYLNGDSKKFQFEGNSLIFWDYLRFDPDKDEGLISFWDEFLTFSSLHVPTLLINLARYLILTPEDLKRQAKEEIKKSIQNDKELNESKYEFENFLKDIPKYGELLKKMTKNMFENINAHVFENLDECIDHILNRMDTCKSSYERFSYIAYAAHNLEEIPEEYRKPVKFFYRILKITEQYIYDLSKSDRCFELNRKNIERFIKLNYKFTAYFSPEIVFNLIENNDVQKYLKLLDAEKNKGQIKYIIDEAKKIKNEETRNHVFNTLWICNEGFRKHLKDLSFKNSISAEIYDLEASQKDKKLISKKRARDVNRSPKTEKNNEHQSL